MLSHRIEVVPTDLPVVFMADNGAKVDFAEIQHQIASSMDESSLQERGNVKPNYNKRDKRFFALFTTELTITSFVFSTTAVTKTLQNFANVLNCRPAGFAIC